MADELGVSVSSEGIEAFANHMARVNEVLEKFASIVDNFSTKASVINVALQTLTDGTKIASAGLVAFRDTLRNITSSGKSLSTLATRINGVAAAFQNLNTANKGGAAFANLQIPALPAAQRAQTTKANAKDRAPAVDDFPNLKRIAERQAQLTQEIGQRRVDRRIADDEKILASARRFAAATEAIERKNLAEQQKKFQVLDDLSKRRFDKDIAAESNAQKAAARIAKQEASTTKKDSVAGARTAQAEAIFAKLSADTERRIGDLQQKLQGRLADALLNRGEEAEIKKRIAGVVEDARKSLSSIQTARGNRIVDPNDIQALQNLQSELKRTAVAQGQLIAAQQKAGAGPSVAFLARARERDAIAGLNAQEFAIGKIAQAARSANPIIRTFARTIFAVEDAAAAGRLSTEAFGIVLQKIFTTLSAISAPVRFAAGAFKFFGLSVDGATGPLKFFLRLAGFKGAADIANLNSEVDKLGQTFKRLKLDDATKGLEGVTKKAKKPIEFRTLQSSTQAIDFDALRDPAKAAERTRAATAAVLKRAEEDRSRSAQRQAQLASATQAQVESIERQGAARVAALESQKAKARELAEQAATNATTKGGQERLNKITQIESQIGAAITRTQTNTAAAIEAANRKLAGSSTTAAKALNAELLKTKAASEQAGQSLSKLGTIGQTAIGVGLGQIAVGALQRLSSGLKGLLSQGLSALGAFESQLLGITTLTRRELLDTDQTLSFADAEVAATKRGEELFNIMQQLAITSPFNTQDVVDIFNLGLSYDFTTKEAEKLTRIMVDFTAGTGRGADAAQRIVLALGQVRSAGKLTGSELKQLRENGVPVLRALADATGKTTKEIADFIAKGGTVDAELAISAIAKTLGTEFAGAAQKSAGTVRGLISSIEDLRDVTLRNIIQPAADALVKPIGQTLAGLLNTDDFQAKVKALGQSISESIKGFVDAVSEGVGTVVGLIELIPEPVRQGAASFFTFAAAGVSLAAGLRLVLPILAGLAPLILSLFTPINLVISALALLASAWQQNWFGIQETTRTAVASVITAVQSVPEKVSQMASQFVQNLSPLAQSAQNVASSILDTFGQLLGQMAEFGANIVTSFASGIISVIGVVIDAIGAIGSAITSLLEPGSPPKLLPFLDKWGAEAADVYLQGWTEGDFGVFDSIAGNIQKALSSIDPDIDEGEIRKIQKTVFDVVDSFNKTGSTDTSAISALSGDIPKASLATVERVAKATLEAAKAAQVLEAAQKSLTDVTAHYDAALKPIEDRLKAIAKQQDSGKEVDQAKRLQNVINNRFATQKQKQSAQLELERLSLEEQKSGLEQQRDLAIKAAEQKVTAAEAEKKRTEENLALLQKRFDLEFQFAAKAAEAATKTGEAMDDAAKKAKKLKEELGTLSADGLESLADLKLPEIDVENKLAPAIESFQARFKEGKDRILGVFDELKKGIELRLTAIQNAFNLGLQGIKDPSQTGLGAFVNNAGLVVGALGKVIEDARAKFDQLRAIFNQGFGGSATAETGGKGEEQIVATSSIEGLALRAGQSAAKLQTAYTTVVSATQKFVTDFTGAFQSTEGGLMEKIFAGLEATDLQENAAKLREKVVTSINTAFGSEQTVTLDVTAIRNGITTALDTMFAAVGEGAEATAGGAGEFAGLAAGVYNQIATALGVGTIDVTALKENVTKAVQGLFNATGEAGSTLVATVKTQLDLLFGEVTFSDLSTSFEALKTGVKNSIGGITWDVPVAIFGGLKTAITDAVSSVFAGINQILSGDLFGGTDSLGDAASSLGGGLGAALGDSVNSVSGVLQGIDITKITAGLTAAIGVVISTAFDGVISFLSETLASLGSLDVLSQEGGLLGSTNAVREVSTNLGQGLVGLIAGALVAVFNFLTPERIGETLKAALDVAASLGGILVNIIVGLVQGAFQGVNDLIGERLTIISSQIEDTFKSVINAIFEPLNTVIEFLNEQGAKVGAPVIPNVEAFEIAISLTSDQFKVILPESIQADLSSAQLNVTGQQVLDAADLVRINGEEKLAFDADQIFALKPDALLKVDPANLVEINGEQKILVPATDAFGFDPRETGRITLAPGEIVTIDKTKPIAVQIPVSPEIDVDAQLGSVVTGAGGGTGTFADKLRQQIQTQFDAAPLKPPPIDTGDPALDVAARAAGVNFATAFGDVDASTQKKLIEKILTLPTDQAAVLQDVGLGVSNGVIGSIVVTSEQIATVQETFGQLRKGAVEGLTTLDSADNSNLFDFMKEVDKQLQIGGQIQSPSELTRKNVGQPLGEGVILGVQDALAGASLATVIGSLFTSGSVTAAVKSGVAKIVTLYKGLLIAIKDATAEMADDVTATFEKLAENVIPIVEKMTDDVLKEIEDMTIDVFEILTTFAEDTVDLFDDLRTDVVTIVGEMRTTTLAIVTDLTTRASGLFSGMRESIRKAVQGLKEDVKDAFTDIRDAVIDLSKEAVEGAKKEFDKLPAVLDASLKNTLAVITGGTFLQQFTDAGKDLGEALITGIKNAISGNAAGQAATQIANLLVRLLGRAVDIAAAELEGGDGGPRSRSAAVSIDNRSLDRINLKNASNFNFPEEAIAKMAAAFAGKTQESPFVTLETSLGRLTVGLIDLNNTLLAQANGSPFVRVGSGGIQNAIAPASPVVQSGGIIQYNYYTLEQNGISDRTAARSADSFSMMERLKGLGGRR